MKAKAKEYRYDEAAEVGGFKIELLRGSITKLDRMFFGKDTLTPKDHLRIDIRFTSIADNSFYEGWSDPFPELSDEKGKKYTYAYVRKEFTEQQRKLAKRKSLEDAVAFELPGDNAKEVRLEMNCSMVGKENENIAFKIPRAFFKSK